MTFAKAERKKAKLRLGICGTSGSGKTYSALLIAKGLGNKIAVVDTENHSAELYAGKDGMPDYDVCILSPPYETEKYVQAITEAERAGYDVIILDSISHAWAGEGGLLDQQGRIADSGRGNSYTAWRNVTPKHNKFIEKMLSCNMHLIATMRSKTEYALITNDKGKQEPKKMGMAPIQREGMDYEFTVVFDMDTGHNAVTSKDRTSLFDGKVFTPTTKTGEDLKGWLESGIEPPVSSRPPENDVKDFKDISDRFTQDDQNKNVPPSNPSPPETSGQPNIVTTITNLEEREKINSTTKKPFMIYGITAADGTIYKTMSKTLADLAGTCWQEQKLVKLWYTVGKYGNDLKDITAPNYNPGDAKEFNFKDNSTSGT
jgi:hypothetical protein